MRLTGLALVLSVSAGPVLAADAPEKILAPAFTGTIVSTYPDGRISKLWLNSDGTFQAEGRGHERQAGRWRIKAHSVCLSQLRPIPIPFLSYCAPIPQSGVASGWSGRAVTGEPITIRLVPDRSNAPAG